jgi:hypothetical protein
LPDLNWALRERGREEVGFGGTVGREEELEEEEEEEEEEDGGFGLKRRGAFKMAPSVIAISFCILVRGPRTEGEGGLEG